MLYFKLLTGFLRAFKSWMSRYNEGYLWVYYSYKDSWEVSQAGL